MLRKKRENLEKYTYLRQFRQTERTSGQNPAGLIICWNDYDLESQLCQEFQRLIPIVASVAKSAPRFAQKYSAWTKMTTIMTMGTTTAKPSSITQPGQQKRRSNQLWITARQRVFTGLNTGTRIEGRGTRIFLLSSLRFALK